MNERNYMNLQNSNTDVRICFDHLCFWEKYGGVSKYFVELIKRLPAESTKLLLKFTNNEYVPELGSNYKIHPFFNNINIKGKAKLLSEIGKLYSIPNLLKGGFNIYHPTHYDCYGFKFLPKNVRTVATVHDMNFFRIPQFYTPNSKLKRDQEKIIGLVDHIITISNKSKEDLQDIFNIPDERITVIYHGIDNNWIKSAPDISFPEPYFLFVGRRSEYKNFNRVLEAIRIVNETYHNVNLYCAGGNATKEEIAIISELKLQEKVKFIQASNIELANLYKQAIGFIFPSFYEGFGLPILEAMSAGCPTILANASCFPEIAGSSALYFSPSDSEELADKMQLLINDNNLRTSLIEAGYNQISKFSWDKSANQHMEVYKSLI